MTVTIQKILLLGGFGLINIGQKGLEEKEIQGREVRIPCRVLRASKEIAYWHLPPGMVSVKEGLHGTGSPKRQGSS